MASSPANGEIDDRDKSPNSQQQTPRTAFISGHIDLTQTTFAQEYSARLDAAIAANDTFIVSTAKGADTMALEYLLAHNVDPSRITIYLHTPPPQKQRSRADAAAVIETEDKYCARGLRTSIVEGGHTERDAVMTRESDYDILWVRSEEDTRALYGRKYRAGRVSGTEKNRVRRGRVVAEREKGKGQAQ